MMGNKGDIMKQINELFKQKLHIVNFGIESFFFDLKNQKEEVINVDWKPVAGGNKELESMLDLLKQPVKYNEKEVEHLLDANHFFKLDYPYQLTPKEQLVKNQKDYTQLLERQKSTREQLSHLTDEEWQLKVLIELSYAELQRLKGQLFLIDETHLFVLEGWLETKKVSVVQSL